MWIDPALIIDPMAKRKKKNQHGDGSYRKRGRHSWELRWMVEGVASREAVRGSEADVRVQLKRRTADAAAGIMPEGLMQRTVGDIVRWRVERYERERPASFSAIWAGLSRILADELAAVRVIKLRRRDIEKFQDRLAESGLAAASVNRYVALITSALRAAAAEDPPLVTHVPRVSPLKADNTRQGFLPAGDYERLMAYMEPEWLKLLFAIGYHVGARAGSILAAKWEQVDWEKKIIRPPGNQPKNKKVGFWPIYGDLEKRLREAEFHHEKYWPHVPWLIHKDGRRLTRASQYGSAWSKAVKDAGLDGLLFHDLRRTAARNLLSAGIDEPTVCRVIGWKNSNMLHRYRIVDELDVSHVGRKAERYLESLERDREREDDKVQ